MGQSWEQLLEAADQAGIKLEVVQGTPTWEAWPASRHQIAAQRIERSIGPSEGSEGCGCFYLADDYIRFPDGSLKRPDISVFCQEPPSQDEVLEIVPAAVVEIVSRGFEKKDLEIGPPFYLSQGVKDVVVVDPYEAKVLHFTTSGVSTFDSPRKIGLTCGCELTA